MLVTGLEPRLFNATTFAHRHWTQYLIKVLGACDKWNKEYIMFTSSFQDDHSLIIPVPCLYGMFLWYLTDTTYITLYFSIVGEQWHKMSLTCFDCKYDYICGLKLVWGAAYLVLNTGLFGALAALALHKLSPHFGIWVLATHISYCKWHNGRTLFIIGILE